MIHEISKANTFSCLICNGTFVTFTRSVELTTESERVIDANGLSTAGGDCVPFTVIESDRWWLRLNCDLP